MENIDRENMTTQLTGALIGLARATEGNANKPTITTHKAMLSGMGMVFPHMEISRQQIDEVIITLHQEKERLVPRCSECKNPCGRNNDYYIYEINELERDLSALKHALLSGILSLEPLLQRFPENELFEQAMDFIYRGFFHVGYDCKIEAVSTLLYELEEMRQKLIDAFLKEAATDKNGNALIELKSNNDLIRYFVNLIEAKDLYTQGHSHHVNAIVNAIFNCLPVAYQNKIDKEKLSMAALLHDVGKILTPDHILNKEGGLNEEEWQIMRQHPINGKSILANTSFADIADWIQYHHERMDGRGYYGLEGTQIPLESRIIAIADTFSALRTYRIYRPAKGLDETVRIMRESAGTQLDKDILDYFLSINLDVLENLECNCEICRQRRKAQESKVPTLKN